MLVYKYMPGHRFFSNFKFRLTPAEELNDPRELVPDLPGPWIKCKGAGIDLLNPNFR